MLEWKRVCEEDWGGTFGFGGGGCDGKGCGCVFGKGGEDDGCG